MADLKMFVVNPKEGQFQEEIIYTFGLIYNLLYDDMLLIFRSSI